MNFQDASNLRIPEGYVRTIHDKDSRLLWGSVGYDVSFDGNAEQTTYSGKNKLNYLDAVPATNQTTTTFIDNGFRSVTTSTGYATKITLSVKASTTYTLSWTVKKVSGTMSQFVRVYEGTGTSTQIMHVSSANDGSYHGSFTTASGVTKVNIWLYNGTPAQGTTDWTFIQLEESATATAYEPYVGGVPAPNPEYPMPISTVTGEQTVTVTGKNLFNGEYVSAGLTATNNVYKISGVDSRIAIIPCSPNTQYTATKFENSNRFTICSSSEYPVVGTVLTQYSLVNDMGGVTFTTDASAKYIVIGVTTSSEKAEPQMQVELGSTSTAYEPYQGHSYTIALGSAELAKVGDYQDHIYKSGDDWYVHKAINKVILDGSEAWNMFPGRDGTFYIAKSDILPASSIAATPNVISDYYDPEPFRNLYNMTVDYGVTNHDAQRWIAIRNKDYSDVSSFKTWLASNSTTVYYVLATPTDTQITDATLIAQLEAVYDWVRRHGYNAQVSGNLPIVINRSTLS